MAETTGMSRGEKNRATRAKNKAAREAAAAAEAVQVAETQHRAGISTAELNEFIGGCNAALEEAAVHNIVPVEAVFACKMGGMTVTATMINDEWLLHFVS